MGLKEHNLQKGFYTDVPTTAQTLRLLATPYRVNEGDAAQPSADTGTSGCKPVLSRNPGTWSQCRTLRVT